MNIKVCGITQLKQLQQLDALDIDFAGLVFDEQSPKYVGNKISPEDLGAADFDIKKVGVFTNADFDFITEQVEKYSLDIVQLDGEESSGFCEELSEDIEVIKTFRIKKGEQNIDKMIEEYDLACDYYLFDIADNDYAFLAKSKIEKPFFISGNIRVEDASSLKTLTHPDLFAVNIDSRFEKEPGVKDMGLILQFREAIRKK
jgi:phosphoribosylanthranilate isomerase